MFHPQPRYAPDPRFIYHYNGISEFQTSPRMSKLVANIPPNRVRSPTDHQFASGCSPPRLIATQLPSTTWLWFTMTRTFTVLIKRLPKRTHSRESGNPEVCSQTENWIPPGLDPGFRNRGLKLWIQDRGRNDNGEKTPLPLRYLYS